MTEFIDLTSLINNIGQVQEQQGQVQQQQQQQQQGLTLMEQQQLQLLRMSNSDLLNLVRTRVIRYLSNSTIGMIIYLLLFQAFQVVSTMLGMVIVLKYKKI